MLRYHMFTIGHSWVSEYGNLADPIHFSNIFDYSPLHNIKFPNDSKSEYPAILVTTSDHDDRVVPSHSYKYTAELQYTIGAHSKQVTDTFSGFLYCSLNLCILSFQPQTQPLLLRIESDAGHGDLSPISKQIEEQVDMLSFLVEALDLQYAGHQGNVAMDIRYSLSTIVVTVTVAVTLAIYCASVTNREIIF